MGFFRVFSLRQFKSRLWAYLSAISWLSERHLWAYLSAVSGLILTPFLGLFKSRLWAYLSVVSGLMEVAVL